MFPDTGIERRTDALPLPPRRAVFSASDVLGIQGLENPKSIRLCGLQRLPIRLGRHGSHWMCKITAPRVFRSNGTGRFIVLLFLFSPRWIVLDGFKAYREQRAS